jgi:hypothetical protein
MRIGVRFLAVVSALITCLAAPAGVAAAAGEPIGPGQRFVGLVNGQTSSSSRVPVVFTVCPGPGGPDRTGPVAGGQTLAVARRAAGGGDTGPFSQVNAWFVQDSSTGAPQQVRFLTYGTPMPVPATVRVPCDGAGQVEFSSCPHLAPCAIGWVPALVGVRFVNIAH